MIFKSNKPRPDHSNQRKPEEPERRPARSAGPTIVTADVVIEGKLITSGELQIDGTMHGDIRASSVVVDTKGSIRGEVVAEEIIVRGRIIGPLHAIHIHIFAGAHVEGDITHETISIENGAFIQGSIRRAEDPIDVMSVAVIEEREPYVPPSRDTLRDLDRVEGPKYRRLDEIQDYAPLGLPKAPAAE